MKNRPFLNLMTKSGYMVGEAVGSPQDIIKRAIKLGHTGAAIADTHNMAAILELYYKARDKKVLGAAELKRNFFPSVVGVTLNITDDLSLRDSDNVASQMIVYAKNMGGYSNACFLSSLGYEPESHFFESPRIALSELLENKDGLVVIDGGRNGYVSALIEKGDMDGAAKHVYRMKEVFGDDYYLGFDAIDNSRKWMKDVKKVVDTGINDLSAINNGINQLSINCEVKAILGITTNMPAAEDLSLLSLMMKNAKKIKNYEPSEIRTLLTSEEIFDRTIAKFPFVSEEDVAFMIDATQEVLEKCEGLELIFTPEIPRMDYKKHPFWADQDLHAKVEEMAERFDSMERFRGFRKIFMEDDAVRLVLLCAVRYGRFDSHNFAQVERLLGEIRDSQRNGRVRLLDYFFFIENAYRYATQFGILTGLGRGSAAGSYLANCLHITSVDPLEWGLLWSRFYTPDRAGVVKFKVTAKPSTAANPST